MKVCPLCKSNMQEAYNCGTGLFGMPILSLETEDRIYKSLYICPNCGMIMVDVEKYDERIYY